MKTIKFEYGFKSVNGIESSTSKNLIITLYFTLISIARSYILRRYFNKKNKL